MLLIVGTNVMESREHVFLMAQRIKSVVEKFDVEFVFKVSFDKANRTSIESYRGLGFYESLEIFRVLKKQGFTLLTDVHDCWQPEVLSEVIDIIQIPAFLCRQTDLIKAVAETGKRVHVKKGQFCSADAMHKCKEKLIAFGNPNVILCERGTMFGYNDLVVDPRNLIWLKSPTNLVTMDITHCLQQPSQRNDSGVVKAGGLRELVPWMGKMAIALGVDGLFIEVHDNPEQALCDGPTQWYLDKLEWLLDFLEIPRLPKMDQGLDE